MPRSDIPAKVDGSARFRLDVRLPDMLFAAIRLCPMLGGAPGAIATLNALAIPGVSACCLCLFEPGPLRVLPLWAKACGRRSKLPTR